MKKSISSFKRKQHKERYPLESKRRFATSRELYQYLKAFLKNEQNNGITKYQLYELFIELPKKLILKILP